MPSDADFDLTDPYNTPPRYNVLHDPHLKEYFQNQAMRKRLIEKGFITPSGFVKCTLLEFNMFRQWIRKLKLDRMHQERRRQRQLEKQQWKERQAREQLLRDKELFSIVREREQKARELKERGIKHREADRRKYLKLQEIDRKRREKFEEDKKRKKDMNECQREKAFAKKQADKVEEEEKGRKIKIRLLVKRSSEDKRRESLLQKRRQTLNEEKEKKVKETWKRRCSLSLERQEEKRRQEEKEREEHIRNVARRTSIVEQQQRKSRIYHDLCLQRRHDILEKQHQKAKDFLERMKEKKIRDLELWKQKHRRLRERHLQQGRSGFQPSDVGPEHRYRSRLSSVWDLQSSLKNEFGIDDNVVYSGVVLAGRKATQRARQLEALAEEETSRQIEEVDEFEKLLSRLEAEFALRKRVHYVVFGIISSAQDVLDIQERLKIGKEILGHVQRIVNNAQEILADEETTDSDGRPRVTNYILRVINNTGASGLLLSPDEQRRQAAEEVVANAISNAKKEFKRRVSLRDTAREIVTATVDSASQRVLSNGLKLAPKKDTIAEDIFQNLFKCAEDIVTVAIVSAYHRSKGDLEETVARSLAADAVLAAKASLEKLYSTTCELDAKGQVGTYEISSSLDICTKEVAAAAIISATRSLERTFSEDDPNAMAARSFARNAVAAAKASLEDFFGIKLELEEGDGVPSMDISVCLAKSATDVAETVVTSSMRLRSPTTVKKILESRVAQSLASDAVQEAVASLENLYGIKVDSEDQSEQTTIGVAAAAVISASQSVGINSEKRDFDLRVAARELANSAMDSVKASTSWLQRENVTPGLNQDTLRMFSSLEEAVKRIAEVTVESATRSLQRVAWENERDLTRTTRELVTHVLNSAKASTERLYGIKIHPEIELSTSSQETSIISSASGSLEDIVNVEENEEELTVAARNLASDAVQAAKASLERFFCIANEMESNIENTALNISKSLVDSSRDLRQRLNKERLGIAVRELGCCAIESAAKSVAKLDGDKTLVQEIVGSDSRLLKAAARVCTVSAQASLGQLFDRGFIGGSELEEATAYMASHAFRSAEAMLVKVQESSSTVDLDLQICKAAFELASHAVVSTEDSVTRLVQKNQPVLSEPGSEHGRLFWKVTTYVKSLINGALRSLGLVGYFNDNTDDLEDYEVISHNETCEADVEYSPHVQDLYQRERLSLIASRIVNDVVDSAKEIVKAQITNRSFFSVPDVRHGYARFTRRRRSSVHFNEGSLFHSHRDSYVPRETDFPSVANRPPTPRFRKAGAGSVASQQIQELDNELSIPSDSDLNTFNATDSGLVQRRLSDPGQGINSENVSVPEPERSASDSSVIVGDRSSSLTDKASLYNVIKKREECASCEISPCGSYVVLPHLNPSECSLIAVRVESYEVLWKQNKSITSLTSLPSFSPKGSFVASEAAQQVLQHQESSNRTVPSSPRLPNITSSRISKRSYSESSLKQSSGHPKRTSSLQMKKSKPCPQSSKESVKLPSKLSAGKGSLRKISSSSCEPLHSKEESGHSSSGSKIAVTQKSSVKNEHHSNLAPVARNETGSSLKRASFSSRSLTQTATSSKLAVPQNKLKSPAKTSILFARADSGKLPSGPYSDKTVKSPRVSAEKMRLASPKSTKDGKHSSRVSTDKEMSSPCVSRETAILSSKTLTGNISPSPFINEGAVMPSVQLCNVNTGSFVINGKLSQSSRTSTGNAVLSPNVSKAKVTHSPRASNENAVLSRNVSKRKVTQSPRTSTEKLVLSACVSKGKIALSPRQSAEIAMLSPRASKGKVIHSPPASTNKAALSPRASKEKATQSQRMSPKRAGLTSRVSDNDIMPSSHTSSINPALSASFSEEKVTESQSTSAQNKEAKTWICPGTTLTSQTSKVDKGPQSVDVSTANAVAILPQAIKKTPSQSATSVDSQEVIKKTEMSEKALKESTPLDEHLEKKLSCSTNKFEKASKNENVEKTSASSDPTSLKTHASRQEGVDSELYRPYGDSEETNENQISKILKKVVPSLERIIQDKRLTPEGAEAETRLVSSADVSASRKSTDPEGLKGNFTVQQALSRSARPSVSKSLSSAASSSVGITINEQGSRSLKKETVSKPGDEDEEMTSRKKPEGEDRSELQGVPSGVVGKSPNKNSKMLVSSAAEIISFPGANKELVRASRDVTKVDGYPTCRKVSISCFIHDTVDDIVQKMLHATEEPTPVEAFHSSGRGSREEVKRDSKVNFGAPSMLGRERKFPSGKVSKTVIDTVDLMLQSVSASDESKPPYSSGRKVSGSDIQSCNDVPRTASSMERFGTITSSAPQGIFCVYGLSPSPPKLPSPKVSPLRATSSQDSLGIRATQSDSSIISSFSDRAADLKPKVSGAWLDDCGNSSVRSQSPKRPQSGPNPALHRRPSEKLSVGHSLEGVSMETHGTLRKLT